MGKDDQELSSSLIEYHNFIEEVIENCKNGIRKMSNKSLLMEGLIQFYSKQQLREEVALHESRIADYRLQKAVTIETREYELERFTNIVRRYLKIGENSAAFEKLAVESGIHRASQKQRAESPLPRSHLSEYLVVVKESKQIEEMFSPLDTYSLERSRNLRMSLRDQEVF